MKNKLGANIQAASLQSDKKSWDTPDFHLLDTAVKSGNNQNLDEETSLGAITRIFAPDNPPAVHS